MIIVLFSFLCIWMAFFPSAYYFLREEHRIYRTVLNEDTNKWEEQSVIHWTSAQKLESIMLGLLSAL